MVRIHPYAHPQHLKAVKHLQSIWDVQGLLCGQISYCGSFGWFLSIFLFTPFYVTANQALLLIGCTHFYGCPVGKLFSNCSNLYVFLQMSIRFSEQLRSLYINGKTQKFFLLHSFFCQKTQIKSNQQKDSATQQVYIPTITSCTIQQTSSSTSKKTPTTWFLPAACFQRLQYNSRWVRLINVAWWRTIFAKRQCNFLKWN